MPVWLVAHVGPRMSSVDGVVIGPCKGALMGMDIGWPIVTNWEFVVLLCENT